MNDFIKLQLADEEVRFTSDGRVAVVDAIAALTEADCPVCIWEELKRKNPRISKLYREDTSQGDERVPVADGRNWDKIQTLLIDYLTESDT